MTSFLSCGSEGRRDDVRKSKLLGLDYVEVADGQTTLQAFFLGKAPQTVGVAQVKISGGNRIRDVHATSVRIFHQEDRNRDDYMEVRVNKAGDFSDYTLSLVALDDQGRATNQPMPGFDVLYSSVDFNFKAGCPSDLDCKQQTVCPPATTAQPEINYLAKDYASFRQLILDRLAVTIPNWQETHTADIGIMLVELLAYAGDYLSYFQDAVATEAYLGTARQRISVRRHARLVDYTMHEGCNSRAWVTIHCDGDAPLDPNGIFFITGIPSLPGQNVFQLLDLARIPPNTYLIFEPMAADTIQLYAAHSEIHFYTWGDNQCCLATGATSATLIDNGLQLKAGDVLIFEEVLGPKTGDPADADMSHRQAVRLTKATATTDQLYGEDAGRKIVNIEWCSEDALTFPLCISSKMPAPDCTVKTNISVARGNVVLVDYGATTTASLGCVPADTTSVECGCGCQPPATTSTPAPFCPQLPDTPLTFAQPLPFCVCAAPALLQDPRQALPEVTLTGVQTTPQGVVSTTWTPAPDLLESGPRDARFVVEIDNDGIAHLRFGDGNLGMMPEAGTMFTATFRAGNGSAGNVGAESITGIVFRSPGGAGKLIPRNPLPASGGTDPEPVENVKMFAPTAASQVLERAITADDYATLASDNARRLSERTALITAPAPPVPKIPRPDQEEEAGEEIPPIPGTCHRPFQSLQGAKGTLRWNGSWYTALVALDPLGTETAPTELLEEVTAYLEPYRRMGHDVLVQPAQYVGLDLGLQVCVLSDYLRGHVEAALLDVFSARMLPDGTKGFFYPDQLTFGTAIYTSRIVAAAQAVTGVQNVRVTRLDRFVPGRAAPKASDWRDRPPKSGALLLGPFEIPRLDDDPNFPEHGRLTIELGGGR